MKCTTANENDSTACVTRPAGPFALSAVSGTLQWQASLPTGCNVLGGLATAKAGRSSAIRVRSIMEYCDPPRTSTYIRPNTQRLPGSQSVAARAAA